MKQSKHIRVKVKWGNIEETVMMRIGRHRPLVGEEVTARPLFREYSKLPTGWSKYEVLAVEMLGCTTYQLKLIEAKASSPTKQPPPANSPKAIKAKINGLAETTLQIKGWGNLSLGKQINVRPLKPGQADNNGPWVTCKVDEIVPLKGYKLYVLSTL